MWATMEKLRILARLTGLSLTRCSASTGRPERRNTRGRSSPSERGQVRVVGHDGARFQDHARRDLDVGADADVGADHAIAQHRAPADLDALPQDAALDARAGPDSGPFTEHGERADVCADLDGGLAGDDGGRLEPSAGGHERARVDPASVSKLAGG